MVSMRKYNLPTAEAVSARTGLRYAKFLPYRGQTGKILGGVYTPMDGLFFFEDCRGLLVEN